MLTAGTCACVIYLVCILTNDWTSQAKAAVQREAQLALLEQQHQLGVDGDDGQQGGLLARDSMGSSDDPHRSQNRRCRHRIGSEGLEEIMLLDVELEDNGGDLESPPPPMFMNSSGFGLNSPGFSVNNGSNDNGTPSLSLGQLVVDVERAD